MNKEKIPRRLSCIDRQSQLSFVMDACVNIMYNTTTDINFVNC
jgi:hypothetical protein